MALPPPYMKARKRFGQNFLVNNHIINSIVEAINPQEGDFLVEIGPGHAALTRPVLEQSKALTAIELDRDLAERLRHDPFLKGLTLIEADALKVDFSQLEGAKEGKLRVFGNLPYNITSPLLFHLLKFEGIQDLHFMLQKEVVERLAAGPGSKDYGRLTVMAQYHAQVIPVLTVPPSAFVPPPKVMSAVVRLKPKHLTSEERALAPFLNKVTATAFGARRKTIRNSLGPLFTPQELEELNISLSARAEDLPLEVFVNLAKALAAKRTLEEILEEERLELERGRHRYPNQAAEDIAAEDAEDVAADDAEDVANTSDKELDATQSPKAQSSEVHVSDVKQGKAKTSDEAAINADPQMLDPEAKKAAKVAKAKAARARNRPAKGGEFDAFNIDADL